MSPHNMIRTVFARLVLPFLTLLPLPAAAHHVPSVLEEWKLVAADDDQASFILRFSSREPQYAPVSGYPRRP